MHLAPLALPVPRVREYVYVDRRVCAARAGMSRWTRHATSRDAQHTHDMQHRPPTPTYSHTGAVELYSHRRRRAGDLAGRVRVSTGADVHASSVAAP